MLRSMTAFAREELNGEFGTLVWEVRSVNHRYLEPSTRLGEEFRSLEPEIRSLLASRLSRGKVECNLNFKTDGSKATVPQLNMDVATNVRRLLEEASTLVRGSSDVSALAFLQWPGMVEVPAPDYKSITSQVLPLLNQTLDDFILAREREGGKLAEALLSHVNAMTAIVITIRTRIPEILDNTRNRLRTRFDELKVEVDQDRLEQEMVFLTQKADVEEELKRLETHLNEVKRIIETDEDKPVGRRLDFLMQELNREANTLCSKSINVETTQAGIDLKVYIEQMREQVQNIE